MIHDPFVSLYRSIVIIMIGVFLLFSFLFILFGAYSAFWILLLWSTYQEGKTNNHDLKESLKEFSPQFIFYGIFHFFLGTKWLLVLMLFVFLINVRGSLHSGYIVLVNILAFLTFLWDLLCYVLNTFVYN